VAAVCFGIGFTPITSLALSISGVCTLPQSTMFLALPVMATAPLLGLLFPAVGRLALRGLSFGVVAVFVYDLLTRFPLIYFDVLGDFIPRIGGWLVGTDRPDTLLGYLWRYLGNGGGMGLAFTTACSILRPSMAPRRAGVLYGVGIWCCLMATLLLSPRGEEMLFPLTPLTLIASLAGHLVYGAALGELVARWDRARPMARPVI
jgi:hypothetical protein